MNRTWTILGIVAAVTVGAGVAMAQEEGAKQGKEPGAAGLEAFKAMDTDGNGTISLEEFKAAHEKRIAERKAKMGDKWDEARAAKMPTAEELFKKMDTNGDGALTPDELRQGRMNRRPAPGEGVKGARGHRGQGDKPAAGN